MPKYFYIILFLLLIRPVFADEINSTNFSIRGDNLSAGSGTSTSASFGLVADVNPFSDVSTSTSFRQEVGYSARIRANTPYPATLANSEQYYDRLLITLNSSNNPTDTLYAVIISSDNFATSEYVQNDGTTGPTLGTEDYRTYASWGGASGSFILGLNQNTAYKVRVKALHGDFTETGYSSDSNEVSTTVPFVNLTVNVPFVTLGVLNVASISQTTNVGVSVNTNAYVGYQVYISDQGNGVNGGLYDGGGSLIDSIDATLTPGVEGYGVQANSATGTVDAKYNVVGNQVGALDTSTNPLVSNTVAVSGENTTVQFKATISASTSAGNYTDFVYFTVTPNL